MGRDSAFPVPSDKRLSVVTCDPDSRSETRQWPHENPVQHHGQGSRGLSGGRKHFRNPRGCAWGWSGHHLQPFLGQPAQGSQGFVQGPRSKPHGTLPGHGCPNRDRGCSCKSLICLTQKPSRRRETLMLFKVWRGIISNLETCDVPESSF